MNEWNLLLKWCQSQAGFNRVGSNICKPGVRDKGHIGLNTGMAKKYILKDIKLKYSYNTDMPKKIENKIKF